MGSALGSPSRAGNVLDLAKPFWRVGRKEGGWILAELGRLLAVLEALLERVLGGKTRMRAADWGIH